MKKLSKQNLAKLKKRILEDGFNVPLFVWLDGSENRLLDGHQRLTALLSLQNDGYHIPALPVAYIEARDEADARKKLLAISSQYGEFDTDELAGWLAGLEDGLAETLRLVDGEVGVGLKVEEETVGDDEAPEVGDGEPESMPGEIYELGSHRLMCGDSTDSEQVARLMGGEKADIWITDPPYNVALGDGGSKDDARKRHRRTDGQIIMNDSQSDDDFREFFLKAFSSAKTFMKNGATFYIWHADNQSYNFLRACRDSGLDVRQCIIWNKQAMTLGRQDYQWKHEPCLYGWKEGASHSWYSDRSQTTVLDFNRPSVSKEHPTMKPVDLFAYCISNSSKEDDIVLDTFGGSGTTIIASAKNGRHCRMMELDPHYCDVIRRRWTKWANENGKEVGSGGLESLPTAEPS